MANTNIDILDLQGLGTYDTKIKTEIAKKADDFVPIEYSEWLELTDAQKNEHNWKLLHVPDSGPEPPDVPDGKTVTPTDDVQILLACAGITDKSYTTLTELFADTTTLASVIANNNAIDYLKRSTTFAKSEALVPILSGNDSHIYIPAGQGEYSGEQAWKAFDGNLSTYYSAGSSLATAYIGYGFDNPVSIGRIKVKPVNASACNWKVQYSDDASIWTDGGTYTSSTADEFTILGDNAKHKYCRVERTFTGATQYAVVAELQFYSEEGLTDNATAMSYIGLNNYASNTLLADSTWCSAICNSAYFESVLNVKVPVMTSDNTPSGVCFASLATSDTSNHLWNIFDNDISTLCLFADGSPFYVGYTFDDNVKICLAEVYLRSNANRNPYLDEVEASPNGTTWNQIGNFNHVGGVSGGTFKTVMTDISANSSFRIKCSKSTTYAVALTEIQFYGRADV